MPVITINHQRIFPISDTHGKHRLIDIPENIQMIIHCGDICNDGNLDEITDFFVWFSGLEIPHKIFISGNHDLLFELEPQNARKLIPENVIWLDDRSVAVNGIRITGINPFFYFQNPGFREKTDILISHYPPFGILDNGIGSRELREYVLETKPKYCIFGHNHENFGTIDFENTRFINCAIFKQLFYKQT